MFQAEIVSYTTLDPRFHTYAEQITGKNSATVVQNGKRPRADKALPLAYFEAFANPEANTSNVKHLLGMLHFGLLVCGEGHNLMFIQWHPHGLTCMLGQQQRSSPLGALFTGDGNQWALALQNAGQSQYAEVGAWGRACHAQFAKHNLDDLIGKIRPNGQAQYLLE